MHFCSHILLGILLLQKKQRINPDWSPRGVSVSGPITKDEEEVAETLFALAGMFHNNGSKHNVEGFEGLQGEPIPENSTVLQDLKEHANVALEGCSYSNLQNDYSISQDTCLSY